MLHLQRIWSSDGWKLKTLTAPTGDYETILLYTKTESQATIAVG